MEEPCESKVIQRFEQEEKRKEKQKKKERERSSQTNLIVNKEKHFFGLHIFWTTYNSFNIAR